MDKGEVNTPRSVVRRSPSVASCPSDQRSVRYGAGDGLAALEPVCTMGQAYSSGPSTCAKFIRLRHPCWPLMSNSG